MKFYFAPMEGITIHKYRNLCNEMFPYIDKFFSPFLVTKTKTILNAKELRDILPENNEGLSLVPQVLTNNAEDFIIMIRELEKLGYKEVNLNLGCPSGTVVSKFRGSGFLAKPDTVRHAYLPSPAVRAGSGCSPVWAMPCTFGQNRTDWRLPLAARFSDSAGHPGR